MDFKYTFLEIVRSKIHIAKSNANLSKRSWKKIDGEEIAKICFEEIKEILELYLYIPCCHTSGMHNPTHFSEKKYICDDQKAKAFERFCKDIGVNPVTKSELKCYWCRDPKYRKGEGVKLFQKQIKAK